MGPSVTRYGKLSPFCHKLKIMWHYFEDLFSTWHNLKAFWQLLYAFGQIFIVVKAINEKEICHLFTLVGPSVQIKAELICVWESHLGSFLVQCTHCYDVLGSNPALPSIQIYTEYYTIFFWCNKIWCRISWIVLTN